MRVALSHRTKSGCLAAFIGLAISLYGQPLAALAHHGGEGAEGAAVGAAATGSTLLTLHGHTAKKTSSDSMWANMLLPMAYERDAEVQKYVKRQSRANLFTMLSIGGVSGLGLAQSIVGFNSIHGDRSFPVEEHDGGEGHVHMHGESRIPAMMGIISSGVTVATLGAKMAFDQVNCRKLVNRQLVIKEQVEGILTKLKSGEPYENVSAQLVMLLGPMATEEVGMLWPNTRQNIVAQPATTPLEKENMAE